MFTKATLAPLRGGISTTKLISLTYQSNEYYVIDEEYDGWAKLIKELILKYAPFYGCTFNKNNIRFGNVGKSSLAHKTANKRFAERTKGGIWVSAKEVIAVTQKIKKTGVLY
jgi:hypothetical protein